MSDQIIVERRIDALEHELSILYNSISYPPISCIDRMNAIKYSEAILSFTKPANDKIQSALKEHDTLEFRMEIKLLVDKFRVRIARHYNK